MKILRKFTNWLRKKFPDPVNGCYLYNDEGCAHVDGLLCGFPNCSMEKEYEEKKLLKIHTYSHFDFDEYCRDNKITDDTVETEHNDKAFISIIGTKPVIEEYLGEHGTKHWFKNDHENVLNLEFDDVSEDGEWHGIPIRAMSEDQAKNCYDFIEKNCGKTFILHCRAAVSRSRAVEAYIKFAHPEYETDGVQITPNITVLTLLKREFYKNNKIFE